MSYIYESWVQVLIKNFISMFTDYGFAHVFTIEQLIGFNAEVMSKISITIGLISSILITAKLLHKLFNVYIIKQDGDPNTSPTEYIKSFVKAIIVTVCFSIIYTWFAEIAKDFISEVNENMGTLTIPMDKTYNLLQPSLDLIFYIVFLIFALIIFAHLVMDGVRLLVLRLGIPFACIGLIDNNNGVYNIFIKKFFQTAFTAIVQVFLVNLSTLPLRFSNSTTTWIPILIGIAILSYSLKVTHDLNEIFLASGASGMGQKMSGLGRGIGSIASLIKK